MISVVPAHAPPELLRFFYYQIFFAQSDTIALGQMYGRSSGTPGNSGP